LKRELHRNIMETSDISSAVASLCHTVGKTPLESIFNGVRLATEGRFCGDQTGDSITKIILVKGKTMIF